MYIGLSYKLVITTLPFKRGYYDALWGWCVYIKKGKIMNKKKEEKAMPRYEIQPVDIWKCPICELKLADATYDTIDLTKECRCKRMTFLDFEPIIIVSSQIERDMDDDIEDGY